MASRLPGEPREVGRDLRDVVSGQHICLMFGDDDERFDLLARFFSAARTGNHKLFFVTDTMTAPGVRDRFAREGFDFPHPPAGEVDTAREAFHPRGRFEPDSMLRLLSDLAFDAVKAGFAGARGAGEMTWALRGVPGSERLFEYETKLTEVIEHSPLSGICQYDVRRFDGATILALLEIHPYMIVRGQVLRNPNFLRVDEYLAHTAEAR